MRSSTPPLAVEIPEKKVPHRSTPLISVIVPTYNAEATVLETIDSICHQTFSDFELIVIDDGSTDRTLARVRSVRDQRVRIFTGSNRGLAESRNRGIERSGGEFISFIDADDMWTPDKLELQLKALHCHTDAALAYSWTAFVDSAGRFLFAKEPSWFEGDVYMDLIRNCNFVASGSNILVRRSCAMAVGGFDTSLEAAHDWDSAYGSPPDGRSQSCPVIRFSIVFRSTPCPPMPCEPSETACCCARERALQFPLSLPANVPRVFRA
jgi:glycosyltransferase involved in cell wall biosynthesis